MPEHHKEVEIYFGEDYYDENEEFDSDGSEILDDPYAEAERLGRIHAKSLLNRPTNDFFN